MAVPLLDTLDIAKRLKEAGFSEAQAEAVTTVFRDVRTADLAELATKADIARLETRIERLEASTKADFERLEASTKADLGHLEASTKADFARLEGEFARLEASTKAQTARLETKIETQIEMLRRDLTIRLGGMIVAATAVLLAAKFLG